MGNAKQNVDKGGKTTAEAIAYGRRIAAEQRTTVVVGRGRLTRKARGFLWGERFEDRADAREMEDGSWWEPVAIIRGEGHDVELLGG